MISNYFTLFHIADDLRRRLVGASLADAFSQESNELVLHFDNPQECWVLIGCEPSRNFLYARSGFQRARRNSISFFPDLVGKTVTTVAIHPNDRVLALCFDTHQALLIEMFASKANVLHTATDGTVVGAFLHPKEVMGRRFEAYSFYECSRWNAQSEARFSAERFTRELSAIGHILLSAAIKKALPTFGSLLVKEVLHRAQLPDDVTAAQVVQNDLEHLVRIVSDLFHQLHAPPRPRVYYEANKPMCFSIISLHHLEGKEVRSFESVHEGIRTFLASTQRQKHFSQQKQSLVQTLRQRIRRTERSMERLREELDRARHAAQNELFGKLLMTHINAIPKHATEFSVENLFSPNHEKITIPLQPQLSAAQNAEYYFEKAKKEKRASIEASQRLAELNQEWELLAELLAAVENVQSSDLLRDVLQQRKEEFEGVGIRFGRVAEPKQEAVPFRVFIIEGGFQVWVGKNSENNDLLTFRYAKANDLWFHARGAGGSHVVLRMGTGKGEPDKRAIEQAAAIAAYYSKMKKARNVPVAMTQRKYVRKPKGAPAGTVTIEREKILFVDPGLPGEHTTAHRKK